MAARLNRRWAKPPPRDRDEKQHPAGQKPLDQAWQKQAKQARRRRTGRQAGSAVDLVSAILAFWP
jgi:hypothetical protein